MLSLVNHNLRDQKAVLDLGQNLNIDSMFLSVKRILNKISFYVSLNIVKCWTLHPDKH